MRARLCAWTIMLLAASCSGGGDETPHEFANGTYQLTTFEITGDCKLDWALSPEMEFVGKALPVEVTASAVSIAVDICGHDAAVPDCQGFEQTYVFTMARDGNSLVGEMPIWLIPGCGCTSFEGELLVSGEVTAENEATLVWTATVTAPDPACECDGNHVCSSTITQRMAQ